MYIDVSVIIVNYRTANMISQCIDSIKEKTTDINFEIIVVDSFSDDGSIEFFEQNLEQIKLMALENNVGFASGNNIGAKNASGHYILLLNPDTLVLDNAIGNLVDFAQQHPQAKIWGGRTLFSDKSLNPSSCWRHMSLWSLLCQATGLTAAFRGSSIFDSEAYGGWKRDTVRHVDIVTGCFLLIERSFWQQLGGFDETFFMYAEEADLCLRASAMGARPMVTPDATIIHYGGASETVRSQKVIKLLTGKMTLIRKHWPIWKAGLAGHLFLTMVLVRLIAFRTLAAFGQSPANSTKAEEWQTVWRDRQTWRRGYLPRKKQSTND